MNEGMDRGEKEDKGIIKKWDSCRVMEALPEVSEYRKSFVLCTWGKEHNTMFHIMMFNFYDV